MEQKTLVERTLEPSRVFQGREREKLLDQLVSIARDGFGTDMTREDVENHVFKVGELYLVQVDRALVGFAGYDHIRFKDKNILYLQGIVIRRDFQRHGLFHRVNTKAINYNGFDFLAMRTQNPVIYAATQKLVKELYPNGTPAPEVVAEIAKYIARDFLKMKDFDDQTFVGRSTYGVCLYDFIPQPVHGRANSFFNQSLRLNYAQGDSVLLVGALKNEKD